MTVSELIEKLKQMPPNRVVVVRGYEDGYDDPIVCLGQAMLYTNKEDSLDYDWWRGVHDCVNVNSYNGIDPVVCGDGESVDVVIISR